MNECLSEDEKGEGSVTPPKKCLKAKTSKSYTQKFREEWMRDSSFKQWLEAPKHPNTEPSCKVCSKKLTCSKTALQRHGESTHHKQAYANAPQQASIFTSLQKQDSINVCKETTTAQVAALLNTILRLDWHRFS